MLAKIALTFCLLGGTFCSNVWAQQDYLNRGPSSSVGFEINDTLTQPRQNESFDSTPSLEAHLHRLESRLNALEINGPEYSQGMQNGVVGSIDKDVAQRLADLEKGLSSQDKAVKKIESGLPAFIQHSHKSPKLQFFGRIHLDYWAFPNVDSTVFPVEGGNPQDRFNFRRLRIGVKGDLNDNMFYKFEGEFAGGNNPSYRDAFVGFKNLPYLNTVIIGNHKRPYGLDHLNSSRFNATIERPFIVEALNQDSRRLGISSNGYTEDEGWNWRYGVFNQILTQNGSGYVGDHYQLEFAGRLARTPWYDESSGGRGYAHFALSGSVGTPDGRPGTLRSGARFRTRPEARSTLRWLDTGNISGADSSALVGLESVVNIGSFNFVAEYMRSNIDRLDAVGEDVAFDGAYAQVSYFLTGEHRPWNRQKGTLSRIKPFENFFRVRDCDGNVQRGRGALEVVARYSYADFNDFDIVGGNAESYTFGLNWYLNAYSRVQLNYISGELDPGRDALGFGDYEIIGLRIMVDF